MFCVIHEIQSNYTHKIEFCLNYLFSLSSYMLRNIFWSEGPGWSDILLMIFFFYSSVVGIFGSLLVQSGVVVLKCLTWHEHNTDKTLAFIGRISALKNSP